MIEYGTTLTGKEYQILRRAGHYVLYVDGVFYCTGDSMREIHDELEGVG